MTATIAQMIIRKGRMVVVVWLSLAHLIDRIGCSTMARQTSVTMIVIIWL